VTRTIGPMADKKRKASGANIPEQQRHTVRVVLRVPPDVAERLDELAERWKLTRSGTVARLLDERED
jgi:macrodomain Ter protein organizer (MatP/YcbG family)